MSIRKQRSLTLVSYIAIHNNKSAYEPHFYTLKLNIEISIHLFDFIFQINSYVYFKYLTLLLMPNILLSRIALYNIPNLTCYLVYACAAPA